MKSCCFTGHRPDKLYGYDLSNEKYKLLANKLELVIVNLIEKHNVDIFISGGALGFDTLAFSVVNRVKKRYPHIKNELAVPFENQDIKWQYQSKKTYEKIKALSDVITYVDELDEYKAVENVGDYHPAKMQKRNQFMVDTSDFVVACWDGVKKGGTYNCVSYAKKQDNIEQIICIKPNNLGIEVI